MSEPKRARVKRHRMTAEQVGWLREHAREAAVRETTARFNEEFETALSWQAVKAHCQYRKIDMGRTWVGYSTEEESWIAEHAHEHIRAGLARAFGARFAHADKKADGLYTKVLELGKKVKPEPGAKRGFTAEEVQWLAHNAPTHDARELTRAFNATFGARAVSGTIRRKCATLGVALRDGRSIGGPSGRSQRWYFNEAQAQWLRTHVGPASWESLSAEFAKSFGATPGPSSLRAKCAVLKIRKPHPRQLKPVTAEQIAWLRTHAPGTAREALTRAFNERFEQDVGAYRISALAKTHGARTGKPAYPFGKREDEWIENACAELDYDALTTAFNETFEARIARATIKYRCKKIGCRAIRGGALHREYSAREVGWLRTNAPAKDLDTLWKDFVATLREVGRYAIWNQCRIRGFEIRRGKGNSPFQWRASEERWLCANAAKATADELTRRFNEHFVAAMGVGTVRAKCRTLGAHCLERYHRYSEEEKAWIAHNTGQLPAGEAARRFNARFATRVTPDAMYRACVKYGTKRNLSTTLRHRRLRFTEQSLLLWIWQVG